MSLALRTKQQTFSWENARQPHLLSSLIGGTDSLSLFKIFHNGSGYRQEPQGLCLSFAP